ncbi:MAG: type VI secretion system baseplate subunit TssF [Desulfobacterales bacterium]|nr:type VI secretion system baseplate subunit TssF [Desulfobacterales bacterium]
MIGKYYERELSHLRTLAQEFAEVHPALAPMLSGQSTDPDVERLLEGTAFLSGLIHEKMDGDFPEIVHGLIQLIFPHYLRPIPSATLIRFTPKRSLRETIAIRKGTAIDAVASEETRCTFGTCYDVALSPLSVAAVDFSSGGSGQGLLRLELRLEGMGLSAFKSDGIRLHLAGVYPEASKRYWMLFTRLRNLRLVTSDGQIVPLGRQALKPVGFDASETLIPFPDRSFPGYRILQEYFILPEKFLFFDVTGLNQWHGRGSGTGFRLEFEFGDLPADLPPMREEHFQLFVSPALNLFDHQADPIVLDHKHAEYPIRAGGGNPRHYQIYAVNKVTGIVQGTAREREYQPFELFNPQMEATPVYALHHRLSPLDGKAELHISVAYPGGKEEPSLETLSMEIMCTNGALPEMLRPGDVRLPTGSSPELAEFTNLRAPTAPVQPPLGKNLLWRLLSHLFLNYLSMANAENLRSVLKLYIFTETRDRASVLANLQRVDSIQELEVRAADRFVGGHLLRGQEILIRIEPRGFAGVGDLYLFGSVLDVFLGNYAAVNAYTRLTIEDTLRKERLTWPIRLGDRILL